MGMGEPLHNYDAVARALRAAHASRGHRHVAAARHAVDERPRAGDRSPRRATSAARSGSRSRCTRSTTRRAARLMPINKKYPLAELIAALRRYPLPRAPRLTIEYTLVAGVNDSVDDGAQARALAARAAREGEPDPDEPDRRAPTLARARPGTRRRVPARAAATAGSTSSCASARATTSPPPAVSSRCTANCGRCAPRRARRASRPPQSSE